MPLNFLDHLPKATQSAVALSVVVLSSAIAYRVIRSTDFELSIANNKLQTSNQLYKTQQLLNDLDKATVQLQIQKEQYAELKKEYDLLLTETQGEALKKLQPAIEKIQEPTGDLQQIADKISESKAELNKLIDNSPSNQN